MSHPPPQPSYAETRRVGAAQITMIRDGSIWFPPRFAVPEPVWRQAMPEADADGCLPLDLNVALIQIGSAVIVIDPGCDDPTSSWQAAFAAHHKGVERSPGLTVALTALGVDPESVTHVLITHAHGDHIGGLLVERDGALAVRFPSARHLIGRAEWEGNPRRDDPTSDLVQRLGPIAQLGLLELVDAAVEVVPGVSMLPAPGETPGHCVVRLESQGEVFFYLGDLVHHPAEVEHLDWVFPGRDVAAMRASRARVFTEASATHALVVSSHETFPAWRSIIREGTAFRWQRADPALHSQ